MVAFSTIKPGDVLYSVERQKMGNTTMRRDVIYTVAIQEAHDDHAIASWNGNRPTRYSQQMIGKLRRNKPEPKPDIFERARMARMARRSQDQPA